MVEFLCGLAFVLLLVMFVGHGMWVAAAWLFRAGSQSREIGKPCPHCGAPFGVRQGRCAACGAVPNVAPGGAPLREDLRTTLRQVSRLLDRGAITQQQYDVVRIAIQTELERISGVAVERGQHAAPPGPSLVPADDVREIVDAVLVEAGEPGGTDHSHSPSEDYRGAYAPRSPVHPLDRPVLPEAPRVAAKPARPLADVLQSFMEESNIRWGEILAALVIVLCSVGLVISVRSTLEAIPYFPAILFTVFTLAFHGAGLYTLRRWKLHAVSRVILIISLLLVPLTFSAAIVMSDSGEAQRPASDPLLLVMVAASIGIFTWVCYSASRELMSRGAWPLTIGIVGCAASQVLIERVEMDAIGFWRLNAIAGVPLASFLVATVWQWGDAQRWRQLSQRRVLQTLLVAGTAVFALLAPLALLLVRSGDRGTTIGWLSPELSLAAAAILALGLLIHRRTTAQRLAAWQTAGTAIVVLGGMLLVGLVVSAWPEPKLLLAVALINCSVLAALGFVSRLPFLYVPATACAALAAIIGLHLAGGHFADSDQLTHYQRSLKLIQAGLMGRTAVALTLLGGLITGLGGWFASRRKSDDALMLLVSASGLAGVAIFIALFSGFVRMPDWPQDRDLSAGVLLLHAIAHIAAGPLTRWGALRGWNNVGKPTAPFWQAIVGCGSLLIWAALIQALLTNGTTRGWLESLQWLPRQPILVATVAESVICALLAVAATRRANFASREQFQTMRASDFMRLLAKPLAISAAIWLCLAAPFVLMVPGNEFQTHAVLAIWMAAAWTLVATSQRWQLAIVGLQTMAALAAALVIAGIWKARLGGQDWIIAEQHLLAQMMALAVGAMIWSTIRRLTSSREVVRDLLSAPWPAVDQALLGAATIGLPVLSLLAVLPSIGWELGFGGLDIQRQAAGLDPVSILSRGWIALAMILGALVVSLWERVSFAGLVGVGVATFAAVWLAAGHFESSDAVASAARWAAAIYAFVWGGVFIARDGLHATAKRLSWLRWRRFPREATQWCCAQPLLLGGTTILIITIIAVQQSFSGAAFRGPIGASIFAQAGPTVSYAGPLLALVAVLLGYALRERQAGFALGGSAVFQLAINLAFLLYVSRSGPQPASIRAIEWLQWNSLAAGLYALIWAGLGRWITPPAADQRNRAIANALWLIPFALSCVAAMALAAWAALVIAEQPAAPPLEVATFGSWLSYAAVALALAAVMWRWRNVGIPAASDTIIWLFAGVVPLAAASMNGFDPGGRWWSYHTLEAGWLAVAAAGLVILCWRVWTSNSTAVTPILSEGASHHLSVALIAGLVVVLAIRGNFSDPEQPWWSLAGTLGCCGIITALALARRSQPYAYASTALAGLAVALFWVAPATQPWIALLSTDSDLVGLAGLEFTVTAVIALAAFWLWREVISQLQVNRSFDARRLMPRVHALVAIGLVPLHFLIRLFIALFYPGPSVLSGFDVSLMVASTALGVLLAGSLWDRRAIWTLPLGYLWLGAVWCLAIGECGGWLPRPGPRVTALVLAVAGQVALTGQLWSYGANLAALGARLGVSDPVGGLARTARWLPVVNLLLTAAVCVAGLVLVLTLDELSWRVAAAWGPAVVAWGVLCLAQERRRDALQLVALLVAGLTTVYLAWAQIDPSHEGIIWMTQVFRLLMVLAALTFVYGLALPRFLLTRGPWNAATRKAGYIAGAAAMATFVATLAMEIVLFEPGRGAPVNDIQVAAVAVVLLGLIAGLISMALLPGRDPLLLSENGRQVYVYAAQATAALLFAHIYLCKPFWFGGILRLYWPFIVMGLAFAGVGAAELFHRFRVRVLAEPLERTGSLLPILPVLGWWVAGSQVDYSLLLFVVGILYLLLSYARKSWAAMIAATVAGNGALWSFLSDQGFSFVTNPQFWLIPPALSVLVAAHVNRHRLTAEILAGIRYAATIVIYLSSTSQIFITGIGEQLWPPMVLLALAMAGALAGIALRVRAFLFLGMTFTLLALTSMIAHASRSINHVWPWWVFGISLSVGVLFLLGILEKKRNEVMQLIATLRQWER